MNYYAKAIDIIHNLHDPIDVRHRIDLLSEIAKLNPSSLVRAHNSILAKPKREPWMDECMAIISSGKFINAVKRCRELTGWGLKEAKEACDKLR